MKKTFTTIAVLMAAITLIGADAPCLIPFQGRLTNQQGIAYTEGQYTLIFNLYDTAVGGTSLWTERHEKVGVINGMVNLFLGSINSLDGQDFSKTRYLGITVDADGNANSYDPEMIPRQMIIPSFHAQNSNKLQGMDWSAVLSGDKTIPIASRYINPDRIHDGTITYEKLDSSVADKLLPTGMIQPYAGAINTIPSGWLPCDGRIVERSKYPKLFELIGTNWNMKVMEDLKEPCFELQVLGNVNDYSNNYNDHEHLVQVSGNIFGAEPGQGRMIANNWWKNAAGGSSGNLGFSYFAQSYTCPFNDTSAGTYRILFSKMDSGTPSYTLSLNYDGEDHNVVIPNASELSSSLWTEGEDIVVTQSIASITASFTSSQVGCYIPAIQMIKVIPNVLNDANDNQFRVPDLQKKSDTWVEDYPSAKLNFIIKY